jgi:hypothetical protein
VEAVAYAYEYRRPSGFFFSYESERTSGSVPDKGDGQRMFDEVKKPHYHLHVGAKKEYADHVQDFPPSLREHDGPHYGTPPVSLDWVLAMIIVNYFPNEKGLIGKLELSGCCWPAGALSECGRYRPS